MKRKIVGILLTSAIIVLSAWNAIIYFQFKSTPGTFSLMLDEIEVLADTEIFIPETGITCSIAPDPMGCWCYKNSEEPERFGLMLYYPCNIPIPEQEWCEELTTVYYM